MDFWFVAELVSFGLNSDRYVPTIETSYRLSEDRLVTSIVPSLQQHLRITLEQGILVQNEDLLGLG